MNYSIVNYLCWDILRILECRAYAYQSVGKLEPKIVMCLFMKVVESREDFDIDVLHQNNL